MNRVLIFFGGLALLYFGCNCRPVEETGKKVFKYNQPESLTSLDLAYARNQGNIWVVTQLYNSLVELDNQLKPAPAIARAWGVSPDGRTYVFHLQPEV